MRTYDAESGELLWDDFVNGTANAADGAADVAVFPHAVYVAGTLRNIAASEDSRFARITSSGLVVNVPFRRIAVRKSRWYDVRSCARSSVG